MDDTHEKVLDRVRGIVREFRAHHENGELEVRMGNYLDGKFVPGIERHEFEQLLLDMQNAPTLQGDENWTEHVDYHYTTRGNIRTRTRVTFDSSTMTMHPEHVCKTTKQECLLHHIGGGETMAYRVSLATEVPVIDPPSVCVPTFVRIQQRRRFRDLRDGNLVWSYELSKTWSASSRSAVEHTQHVSPPVYEVECELVDENKSYLHDNDDERVAKSILMKSQVLLGEDGDDENHSFALVDHNKRPRVVSK